MPDSQVFAISCEFACDAAFADSLMRLCEELVPK